VASSVRRLRSEMGEWVLMPPGSGRLTGKVFREPDDDVPVLQTCDRAPATTPPPASASSTSAPISGRETSPKPEPVTSSAARSLLSREVKAARASAPGVVREPYGVWGGMTEHEREMLHIASTELATAS